MTTRRQTRRSTTTLDRSFRTTAQQLLKNIIFDVDTFSDGTRERTNEGTGRLLAIIIRLETRQAKDNNRYKSGGPIVL